MAKCKIPIGLIDTMFSLWMSGFTYEQLAKELGKLGHPCCFSTIARLAKRHKWAERKAAYEIATHEYYDEIMKNDKLGEIQAWSLASKALCREIINDFIDYNRDPVAFRAAVQDGTRGKPIWMVQGTKDAQVLMETKYLLLREFKKGPDTEINITKNDVSIQILNAAEQDSLLHLLAEAKERALIGAPVEEAEIEEVPEKCSKT